MKFACTILLFLISGSILHAQTQSDYSIRELKNGSFTTDKTYIYALPFQKGKKVYLVQAYDSKFSHKGENALDFKVKEGTTICAAREGTVIAVRSDSDKGGLKPEHLSDGNFISIQHSDGSVAHYWHLKKDGVVVKVADKVVKGQVIGYSGNTGYSAFPHLHFEVVQNGNQVPTRFSTKKGIKYLRPSKKYLVP
ncbi:M23 family metallopeptidase [Lacibacter luteus]|uniref:M23 family metallopeptidase n=1 Tax=Lacibacter luteus TaxID=2508719 RepID=A0A4Q1CJN1_9BACT|nr:M23 family metallopeptidase [Lacibacter luteus]RXK60532.1 M23 family metallopeptidase [Lacibacter luteus]